LFVFISGSTARCATNGPIILRGEAISSSSKQKLCPNFRIRTNQPEVELQEN